MKGSKCKPCSPRNMNRSEKASAADTGSTHAGILAGAVFLARRGFGMVRAFRLSGREDTLGILERGSSVSGAGRFSVVRAFKKFSVRL